MDADTGIRVFTGCDAQDAKATAQATKARLESIFDFMGDSVAAPIERRAFEFPRVLKIHAIT